jgi:hypothetical protein
MPTAHADNTAANTAGFKRTETDRGAGASGGRFLTTYEKHVAGVPGASGGIIRQQAVSDVSQADASAKALAAVNSWRDKRYGYAAAGGSPGHLGGSALTVDLN